jgi:hypothetical protein
MNDTVNTESELWDRNQGKRLIKRLKKHGIGESQQFDALFHLIRTGAAKIATGAAKRAGASADESMAMAIQALNGAKTVERTGNLGFDLTRLLMANGAPVGRIKSALDDILAVAKGEPEGEVVVGRNVLDDPSATPKDEPFIDHEHLDRFPDATRSRENY